MPARYSKWEVTGYTRTRHDEHGGNLGREIVVVVTEPGAWEWELVLDGDVLRDFRMVGWRGPVTRKALNYVPLADLIRMAQAYLARVHQELEDGLPTFASLQLSELTPGEVKLGRPSDEELARAWHEIGPRTPDGTPRRKALADRFSVSPSAIDVWIRDIRSRTDLIPQAQTGRGHTTPPDLPEA